MTGYEGGNDPQEINRQAKTKAWLEKLEEIEQIRDALGFPIDKNIRETIAALNVSGIPTSASCEGHIDRGKAAPWIKIEAPNRPSERFVAENSIFASIAEKYGSSIEDVKTARNREAWKEAINLAADHEETEGYQIWRRDNQVLQEKLATLLENFYQGRTARPSMRLEIGHDPEGTARLHNGGDDYKKDPRNLTEDERREVSERLVEYQHEMTAFADFLEEADCASP